MLLRFSDKEAVTFRTILSTIQSEIAKINPGDTARSLLVFMGGPNWTNGVLEIMIAH